MQPVVRTVKPQPLPSYARTAAPSREPVRAMLMAHALPLSSDGSHPLKSSACARFVMRYRALWRLLDVPRGL